MRGDVLRVVVGPTAYHVEMPKLADGLPLRQPERDELDEWQRPVPLGIGHRGTTRPPRNSNGAAGAPSMPPRVAVPGVIARRSSGAGSPTSAAR